jgi:two-component system, cell cycle sensor histidine kinase and response regulator CckA
VLDAMADPVLVVSPVRDPAGEISDLRIEYANQAAEAEAGAIDPSGDLVGRSLLDLSPTLRSSGRFDAYVRVIEQGGTDLVESITLDPSSGAPSSASDIRASRAADRLLIVARDVTKRVRSEREREEAETRLRALIASLPHAVLLLDADGAIVSADGSVRDILGFEPEEIGGVALDGLVPGVAAALDAGHRRGSAAASSVPTNRRDLTARRRDGSDASVEVALSPIELDGRAMVLATVTDVTEHRRRRKLLEDRESDLEEAQRVARVGSWTLDPATGEATWSAEMYRILGLDPDDPPVDLPDISTLFTADSVERVTAAIGAAVASGASWRMDLELVGEPGPTGWVESIGIAERDASGGVHRIRGTMQDITAQRDLEAQLRKAQRLEAVGQLAGGIAHDFNNLLTVIRGYAETVADELDGGDPQVHADLHQILGASDRAAGLVRQLLAFARRQVLAPEILDPDAVVKGLVPMLRRLLGEHIEIATVLQAGAARVQVDPGQLEQVIVNLAVNARDAMPDGGPLTIETRVVELDEPYTTDHVGEVVPGPHVLLTVTDAGQGMDPGTRARIFEPFFTTKEAGKGTGMGLATVFGIVNQSGGSIQVYSEPGRGTTFKLYFPIAVQSADAQPRATPVANPSVTKPRTILVVEDDAAVRGFTRRSLEEAGHRVLEAANGAAALALSNDHAGPIDALVTDVIMPNMLGHELAERLVGDRPELRVLFVSGFTENSVIHHGVPRPGVAFLPKPFSRGEIADAVAGVLAG